MWFFTVGKSISNSYIVKLSETSCSRANCDTGRHSSCRSWVESCQTS